MGLRCGSAIYPRVQGQWGAPLRTGILSLSEALSNGPKENFKSIEMQVHLDSFIGHTWRYSGLNPGGIGGPYGLLESDLGLATSK